MNKLSIIPAIISFRYSRARAFLESSDFNNCGTNIRNILEPIIKAYGDLYFSNEKDRGSNVPSRTDLLIEREILSGEVRNQILILNRIGNDGAHANTDKNALTKERLSEGLEILDRFISYTVKEHPEVFSQSRFAESSNEIFTIVSTAQNYLRNRRTYEASEYLEECLKSYSNYPELKLMLAISRLAYCDIKHLLFDDIQEIEGLLVEPIKAVSTRDSSILLLSIIRYDYYYRNKKHSQPDFAYLHSRYIADLTSDNHYEDVLNFVHYSHEVAAKIDLLPVMQD